jgi:probable rRNA maturation factor
LLKIKEAQINIYFVNSRCIQSLNRIYLKKDCPTDVISFNLRDKKSILAEIFICLKIARENAFLYKSSFACEVMLYIIHALLHILGYEDKNKKERNIMLKKQNTLLEELLSFLYSKYKIKLI